MPRRRSAVKPSRQLTKHIETMANYFQDVIPELDVHQARTLASNLVIDPPEDVILALRSMIWLQRPRKVLRDDDERHGTTHAYTNFGCRCEPCKEANSKASTKRRLTRVEHGLPEDDDRHGTYNAYTNYGCRCQACKLAARDRYVGDPRDVRSV